MVARHNYSEKLALRICELVSEGESLRSISEKPGMPPRRSVRDWLMERSDFAARYEVAKRQRCDNLIDEAIEIADSCRVGATIAEVAAARLAVDTRKWLASKLLPERFGDRIEHVGAGGAELIPPDRSKVALVLLNIIKNARPTVEIDAASELEPALEAEPVRLEPLAPPSPPDEVIEPAERLPTPQWGWNSDGRVRHVSELAGGYGNPLRVIK